MDTFERLTVYYENCFWGPEGDAARAYMLGRKFSEETLRTFRVGFSPETWSAPMDLEDMKLLKSAGHITTKGRDFLAGRVVFPIADEQGAVKGYCGRVLRDSSTAPKYMVSLETEHFRKGDHLYGLHLTRGEVFLQNRVILVEGFTDSMAYYQKGARVSVALMGVKLTEEQMTLLAKYTSSAVLSLDPDAAGNPATKKIIANLSAKGFSLGRIAIPVGVDPAEFLLG